jgi:hypothetical protein
MKIVRRDRIPLGVYLLRFGRFACRGNQVPSVRCADTVDRVAVPVQLSKLRPQRALIQHVLENVEEFLVLRAERAMVKRDQRSASRDVSEFGGKARAEAVESQI